MQSVASSLGPAVPDSVGRHVFAQYNKNPESTRPFRFSKKHDKVGYSGWAVPDPVTKRIHVTVQNKAQRLLYKTDPKRVPKEYEKKVKAAVTYSYSVENPKDPKFQGAFPSVVKRAHFPAYDHSCFAIQTANAVHAQMAKKAPSCIAEAPISMPVYTKPGNAHIKKFESIQIAYHTDLFKLSYHRMLHVTDADFIRICLNMCDALAAIHEEYLHCDVRPDNILVYRKDHVAPFTSFLNDFELVQDLGTACGGLQRHRWWDKLAERRLFTPFTDIYGLAMTLGEVLFGQPFNEFAASKDNFDGNKFKELVLDFLDDKGHISKDEEFDDPQHPNPKVRFYRAVFDLLDRVTRDSSALLRLYENPEMRDLSLKERLTRFAQAHISLTDFKASLTNLLQLASNQ